MNTKNILNIKNIPKELLISLTEALKLRRDFEAKEILEDQYD